MLRLWILTFRQRDGRDVSQSYRQEEESLDCRRLAYWHGFGEADGYGVSARSYELAYMYEE